MECSSLLAIFSCDMTYSPSEGAFELLDCTGAAERVDSQFAHGTPAQSLLLSGESGPGLSAGSRGDG